MNDWRDIEELALHEPVLHAAVTRVRQGASREEALIIAVGALVGQLTALRGAKLDAAYFGNGFVQVVREAEEFRCRRLDPALVTITIRVREKG
jgi:hypothetical protein